MNSTAQKEILKITNLSKSFQVGDQRVPVIKNVTFNIKEGDFMIIYGPSGCGKSTLLHTILGLEPPSNGSVVFLNKWLYTNSTEDDRSDFRKKHIGMVYQQPNWIKALNVIENVAFPLVLLGHDKNSSQKKAGELLKLVAMEKWAEYRPTELSSGQQQKVSLCRALINNPEVIIADEPTGNLDFDSGQELMNILSDLNTKQNKTIIMVTHDLEYLKFCKSSIKMLDGEIIDNTTGKNKDKNIKLKRISNYAA